MCYLLEHLYVNVLYINAKLSFYEKMICNNSFKGFTVKRLQETKSLI